MLVATVAVDVAMLQFLGAGLADLDDLDVEVEILAGHRVVEVDIDHGHPHLLDRHRARAEVGIEHYLHSRLEAGENFTADVPAADAYGELREGLSQRVPKKHFGDQRLAPGMQVVLNTNFGPRAVTIQKVGMSVVDIDLNHPMAGKDLHFDVEIVDVREASPEELEHGHVHGDGGHQH